MSTLTAILHWLLNPLPPHWELSILLASSWINSLVKVKSLFSMNSNRSLPKSLCLKWLNCSNPLSRNRASQLIPQIYNWGPDRRKSGSFLGFTHWMMWLFLIYLGNCGLEGAYKILTLVRRKIKQKVLEILFKFLSSLDLVENPQNLFWEAETCPELVIFYCLIL